MRYLLAIGLSILLAGCANEPIAFSAARGAPAQQIYSMGQGDAAILVTRDAGYQNAGADVQLFVNGELRASLGQGEKVKLLAKSGKSIIGVKYGVASNESLREMAVVLEPGENRFRMSVTNGPDLMPTTMQ